MNVVVFSIHEQRFALRLIAVIRVIWAVEVTLLPRAPGIILGMINFQGQIIPVVDARGRFGLPARSLDVADQFVIARARRRLVALPVDAVVGVAEFADDELVAAEKILPSMEPVEGVLKLSDGMILVHDLDRFLSLEEEENLAEALLPLPLT